MGLSVFQTLFSEFIIKQLNEDALKLSELNQKFKACSIMLGKCSSNFVAHQNLAVNNADFITRHVSPLGKCMHQLKQNYLDELECLM